MALPAGRRGIRANLVKSDGTLKDLPAIEEELESLNDDLSAFKYTQIVNNTDLDTIINAGMYGCPTASIATTLLNCPVKTGFALLVVLKSTTTPHQIIFETKRIYVRTKYTAGWSDWYVIEGTSVSSSAVTNVTVPDADI